MDFFVHVIIKLITLQIDAHVLFEIFPQNMYQVDP